MGKHRRFNLQLNLNFLAIKRELNRQKLSRSEPRDFTVRLQSTAILYVNALTQLVREPVEAERLLFAQKMGRKEVTHRVP